MEIATQLQNLGIDLKSKTSGQIKTICPGCSEGRRNKKDPCLSVNIEQGMYHCHHCGFSGMIKEKNLEYVKPTEVGTPLNSKALNFFLDRGISKETVNRFNITQSEKGIHFNYFYGSDLVNIKFRNVGKKFSMVKGGRLMFYNMNSIFGADTCYITEGEMDALAVYEAGYKSVISVPNGAHAVNNNLVYLDDIIDDFDQIEKIVIMTDADNPGVTLRNELARRFGKHRCYYVNYPAECKDANDVLIKHGKEGVCDIIENCNEFPLDGITTVYELDQQIDLIFENGYPSGDRINNELDEHIKWRPQEWTVVTGRPGSGKSDVVDQISLALAVNGWKFGVFSPENKPYELHFWKLAQKVIGKMRKSMSSYEKDLAKEFISSRYFWIDMETPNIDDLLSKSRELVKRKGVNGFIFDPWNQLDHQYQSSETQYVSEALSKLTEFVQNNDAHIFLVAHPTKSRVNPNKLELYDISGSAHFYNKCYNGITVGRDYNTKETIIGIEKVKFWFVGKAGGEVRWYWDVTKGTRYFDLPTIDGMKQQSNYYEGFDSELGF